MKAPHLLVALALAGAACGEPSTAPLIQSSVETGQGTSSLAVGDNKVWLSKPDENAVLSVNAKSGAIDKTVDLRSQLGNGTPGAAVFGGGLLWVADSEKRTLYQIDSQKGAVAAAFSISVKPKYLAFGKGLVWVSAADQAAVLGIDAATGTSVAELHGVGGGPVVADQNVVWVATPQTATLTRIDGTTNRVSLTTPTSNGVPDFLALGAGSVWAARRDGSLVSRIDQDAGRTLASVKIPGTPTGLAYGRGGLFVLHVNPQGVSSIDSATNLAREVAGDLGLRPGEQTTLALEPGTDQLWAASASSNRLIRLQEKPEMPLLGWVLVGFVSVLTIAGYAWVVFRDYGVIVGHQWPDEDLPQTLVRITKA